MLSWVLWQARRQSSRQSDEILVNLKNLVNIILLLWIASVGFLWHFKGTVLLYCFQCISVGIFGLSILCMRRVIEMRKSKTSCFCVDPYN